MAFHLGCLRALNDYDILTKVQILSAVSGGSVIAALYAYYDEPFEAFDERVTALLRRGLFWGLVRHTLFSPETPKIIASQLTSGVAASGGAVIRGLGKANALIGGDRREVEAVTSWTDAPLRRFASRSTAFERYLRKAVYGDTAIDEVARDGLEVVLNAAELRTGTAFRFGSSESGCWRYGTLINNQPLVSQAVSASACYPAALPSFDLVREFEKNGVRKKHRVILTDGGIYDNLGITTMLPGRSAEFSSNAHEVDFIIACDAGAGMPSGISKPYLWSTRMRLTVETIHRRTHALSYNILHNLAETGKIDGFLLPYLGQIDERLPYVPGDFVNRDDVFDYPTDFSAMSEENLRLLSSRGEQLCQILIDHYNPEI